MSERLPLPVSGRIRDTPPVDGECVVLPEGTPMVRVHPRGGATALAWNELRAFGPTNSRFDHQPPPPRRHPRRRIGYFTVGPDAFVAALAECFQDAADGVGPLDLTTRRPVITVFETTMALTLVDLDSGWVTRAGGNQAIQSGPRAVTRAWSRAVYRHHHGLHGLAYRSSVWGPGRCVALWERGAGALPAGPTATRPLDDPGLTLAVLDAANRLGTVAL